MESGNLFKTASGIRLNIEMGNRMRFLFHDTEEPIGGALVGLEPQEYLIVRLDLPAELNRFAQKGDQITARYMSLGNEYGFSATIIEHIASPDRLVFITYPDEVENIDIRKSSRVSCFIPATAIFDGRKLKGTLTDISQSGCRFVIRLPATLQARQLRLVDEMQLKFPLMGIEGIQEFTCKVRNTSIDKERIAMGVEFTSPEAELTKSIKNYIKKVVEIQKEE
ncbi:MAG: flagellar brake protein [Desulfobacterales bacterium]|nr:flagellar brake protein [Desulfobacterales bacterium]